MDPEELARLARARSHRGHGADHAGMASGGHHHTDAATPGRSTRVATPTPTMPRATRSVQRDYAGTDVTARLDGGGGSIFGTIDVRVATAGGGHVIQHYTVHGALAWDNTGSTGFRGEATRGDGAQTRITLVLSGRGHLHVELMQPPECSGADLVVTDRLVLEADAGEGRTVLTAGGPATLTEGVASGAPYPDLDVILEQIAHRFAYMPAIDPASRDTLRQWGWEVVPHGTTEGDLQMLALRPVSGHPEPRDPVLAFRGTEPTHGADWADDFDSEGVGMYQFDRNEGEIQRTLRALGGGVIVTGHSLGGALAQICAARYPGSVAQVVTFQSPGVSSELADRVGHEHHISSRHHVVDGCVVSGAGEAHTAGTTYHHHALEVIDPLSAHLVMPLAEEQSAMLPDGAGFTSTRRGFGAATTTSEDPSIGAFEVVRGGVSGLLDDPMRDRYVRQWSEIRSLAREGRTPYRDLVARTETMADAISGGGLRANLDMMFPELAVAGECEGSIHDGSITSEHDFVATIDDALGGLTATQRTRLRAYWDTVGSHAGEHRHDMAP